MRPYRKDHRFPDGPLHPNRDYLERQREMMNLELAMMPKEMVGTDAWARKAQDIARVEALLSRR